MTSKHYGMEGQKSIDAEVFFKFMPIGYLENIHSVRKIIEYAQTVWRRSVFGVFPQQVKNVRSKRHGVGQDTVLLSRRMLRWIVWLNGNYGKKPGKVPALNHLGIISADTEHHIVCGATADFADIGDAAADCKNCPAERNILQKDEL
jgi:hypothetical protein